MSEETGNGLINLYLGPLSSFCGCHNGPLKNELSLSVDFQSDITKEYPSVQEVKKNTEEVLWDEKIVTLESGADKRESFSPYSPDAATHWSQLGNNLSDRNLLQLGGCNNFKSFHTGCSFYEEHDLAEQFEEKIRYHTEKCDILKGFVNVYDSDTGYGGILSRLIPLIDDVYGHKAKMSFGIGNHHVPNLFEFDCILSGSVATFLRSNFPKGSYNGLLNHDTVYHNAALHSLFLQQTLRAAQGTDFKDFTSYLSPLSRNLVTSFMSVPFDSWEDRSLHGLFKSLTDTIMPVSLYTKEVDLPLQNSYVSCSDVLGLENNHQFFSALSQIVVKSKNFSSSTRYSYSSHGISLSETFPQFFSDMILSDGRLRDPDLNIRTEAVRKLPVLTILQNSSQSSLLIEAVLKKKIVVNKSPELLTAGVLQEDVEDARQRLNELLDNYNM